MLCLKKYHKCTVSLGFISQGILIISIWTMSAAIFTAIATSQMLGFCKHQISGEWISVEFFSFIAGAIMYFNDDGFFFFCHVSFWRMMLLMIIANKTIAPPMNAPLPGISPAARKTQRGFSNGSSTGISTDSKAVTCCIAFAYRI